MCRVQLLLCLNYRAIVTIHGSELRVIKQCEKVEKDIL